MREQTHLENRIRDLRQMLDWLIENKDSLQDEEIIKVSKMLDELLNQYEQLMKK